MRIMAFLSNWKRDFKHFFTLMKGALWAKRSVNLIVSRYGTAGTRRKLPPPLIPKPFFKENHPYIQQSCAIEARYRDSMGWQ